MAALPPLLAVDDSPDDLFFLKRILVRAGVKNLLITLEDGVQAQAFLSGLLVHPDSPIVPCIIFTDLNMPVFDGLELVRWIRKQAFLRTLPVVMLSSSSRPEDDAAARLAGATDYFQKFPVPDVLARLIPASARG